MMAASRGALVLGVGAKAGLGGALCRRFAREGLVAFAAGRTQAKLDAVADEIRSGGGRAYAIAMDVTSAADMGRAFESVEKETGAPPELVVYNAGNMAAGALGDMTDAFFEDAWRVSAFGAFLCGREAAQRMVPRGRGTLIFTGATSSLRSRPPFIAFAAAKAAERAVAHGLAREFGPQGVHVAHVVIDGVIDGDLVNSRAPQIRDRLGADGMISIDALADSYWMLHTQPRSAWTLELDLRPYKEQF
jgi:NAD(P)-dependent dehydrogenase (short-subunit alcohol dehydrogenase family)